MKMLITHDWLRAKIAEPEPEACEAGVPTDRDLAVEIQRLRDTENAQHDMLTKVYGLAGQGEVELIRDAVGTFLYGATLEP